MIASIRSEFRKTLTTRMWWLLLLCEIALVAFFAASMGLAFSLNTEAQTDMSGNPMAIPPREFAIMIYTIGVSFGYVFPLVLGALAVTTEVRHSTLDTTVVLQPRRGKVIVAKFVAIVPFALLFAVTSIATGLAVGAGALAVGGEPLLLDDPHVWRAMGMGLVALTAWALVGVGFGTAVTNQVAVIVVVLAFTQFVEPVLRFASAFAAGLQPMGKFFPGAAGEAIVGSSLYSLAGAGDILAPWAGFAVLLAYGVMAAVIGWLTTFRKDLT